MREVTLDSFEEARAGGAAVIDVREPVEYVAGHVPGARPVPMGQLPSRLGELDKDQPVYVICASGNRSLAMTSLLVQAGYDAWSVAGGTGGWARSGRPVVEGPQPGGER